MNIRLKVPSTAGIGSTNEVKVQVRDEDGKDINATADHKTPGAMLTVTERVEAGGSMNVSGSNFEGFSTLSEATIGGNNVLPSPSPETNGRALSSSRCACLS